MIEGTRFALTLSDLLLGYELIQKIKNIFMMKIVFYF